MTDEILAVICARGGSQGVPGKNIMSIAGKPLIGWAVETARSDPRITDVVVSTDDPEIAQVALKYGLKSPFIRPADLSTSTSGKFGVWKHALSQCEDHFEKKYDHFLDVDCTTPLLDGSDLTGFLNAYFNLKERQDLDGMFTTSPSHRSPYFNLVEKDERGYLSLCKKPEANIESRQSSPKTLDIVAGFYIFHADYIRKATYLMDGKMMSYEVPREKSFDIDEPFDAELVSWLMERKHNT